MRYSQKTLLTSPFHATGLLLTFTKSSETRGFLKISGVQKEMKWVKKHGMKWVKKQLKNANRK